MKLSAVLMVLIMGSVVLAGCTGDDAPVDGTGAVEGKVDETQVQLEAGKGAISGLLVDDRFRPIDLTDDPTTEFQAEGFVLLQETGEQVRTNENGEFTFLDLEPGTYTLRVTAEGHETTPSQVNVEEGLFAEKTLIARRVTSEGGSIVTEEYTGFAACSPAVIATSVITNCIDTSGESDRRGTFVNFTALNASYMIVEIRVDEPGYWIVQVSGVEGSDARSPQYGTVATNGEVYGKRIYEYNGTYDDQNPNPWENDQDVRTLMFFQGDLVAPGSSPTCDAAGAGCQGLGMAIGKRVRMLFSVFVGEPEVDLEAYEALGADAT